MKRLSIILTLLSALCLFGYDLMVYPTLMVNLTDQIKFVMPNRAKAHLSELLKNPPAVQVNLKRMYWIRLMQYTKGLIKL